MSTARPRHVACVVSLNKRFTAPLGLDPRQVFYSRNKGGAAAISSIMIMLSPGRVWAVIEWRPKLYRCDPVSRTAVIQSGH